MCNLFSYLSELHTYRNFLVETLQNREIREYVVCTQTVSIKYIFLPTVQKYNICNKSE